MRVLALLLAISGDGGTPPPSLDAVMKGNFAAVTRNVSTGR